MAHRSNGLSEIEGSTRIMLLGVSKTPPAPPIYIDRDLLGWEGCGSGRLQPLEMEIFGFAWYCYCYIDVAVGVLRDWTEYWY